MEFDVPFQRKYGYIRDETVYIAVVWEVGDSYVVQLLFVADFGVSAKNVTERQKRDSFIGTPYW